MKFVFIDEEEIIKDETDLKPLNDLGSVTVYDNKPETEEELLKRAEGAEVIFFALTKFTKEILEQLPDLKILQFLGTGMWNLVDVDYAASKGIKVLNIEGYGNNAVAEYAIGLAFALARNIPGKDRQMRQENWDLGKEGREISSSTFGIIGTGNIGSSVAKKALALGAEVIAYDIYEAEDLKDRGVQYLELEELVAKSDFISLHVKATKETENLINRNLINMMKKSAFLINTARAELIDYNALYEALESKKIAGAALDVFADEPPTDFRISMLNNVITSPHRGFYTENATDNMFRMSLDSVLSELKSS